MEKLNLPGEAPLTATLLMANLREWTDTWCGSKTDAQWWTSPSHDITQWSILKKKLLRPEWLNLGVSLPASLQTHVQLKLCHSICNIGTELHKRIYVA